MEDFMCRYGVWVRFLIMRPTGLIYSVLAETGDVDLIPPVFQYIKCKIRDHLYDMDQIIFTWGIRPVILPFCLRTYRRYGTGF